MAHPKEISRGFYGLASSYCKQFCAFRDEGRICDAPRNCVRKTTAEEDAALVQVAEANPFVTAGQIRDVVGLDVSEELVRKVDVLPESRFFRTQQEQKDWLLPRLIFTGQ